jgi:predicted metalloprotease
MNNSLRSDIDEALSAAHAVGDDAIQAKIQDILFQNFTHGTSAQRKVVYEGYKSGDINQGDTLQK